MVRVIRKASILVIILLALSSCSSSPRAGQAPESSSSYEYDESSNSRSSENTHQNRMVAYTVGLELSVKDPDETRRTIAEQIRVNNGFIVQETEDFVSARIPAENMDSFLESVRALGKIRNETKAGTDITDRYRDNVIRLDSLKNIRDRYLALLARANDINDILRIEREIERVILEIERLEGTIRQSESIVAYSLITVRYGERAKPGPIGWIFYGLFRGIKWLFVWD